MITYSVCGYDTTYLGEGNLWVFLFWLGFFSSKLCEIQFNNNYIYIKKCLVIVENSCFFLCNFPKEKGLRLRRFSLFSKAMMCYKCIISPPFCLCLRWYPVANFSYRKRRLKQYVPTNFMKMILQVGEKTLLMVSIRKKQTNVNCYPFCLRENSFN